MKVIVTDEVAREGLALLEQDPRVEMDVRLGLSKEELLKIIGDYEVIITRSGTTVDKALLDAATKLKLVARAGVGIDNVDVDYASSRGVIGSPCLAPWRSGQLGGRRKDAGCSSAGAAEAPDGGFRLVAEFDVGGGQRVAHVVAGGLDVRMVGRRRVVDGAHVGDLAVLVNVGDGKAQILGQVHLAAAVKIAEPEQLGGASAMEFCRPGR